LTSQALFGTSYKYVYKLYQDGEGSALKLSQEVIDVLTDLNPWWAEPGLVRPAPPTYRRRAILKEG